MRDPASAATNIEQKPRKRLLISCKLESICKIKVGKYEIELAVFKVLLFLLRFPTYSFSYLTNFVSIDRYNLNLLSNLCNNYIHVTNTRSSWATYDNTSNFISNLSCDDSGYLWKGNLSQLNCFVKNDLKLAGKWSSPGDERKIFNGRSTSGITLK